MTKGTKLQKTELVRTIGNLESGRVVSEVLSKQSFGVKCGVTFRFLACVRLTRSFGMTARFVGLRLGTTL